MQPSENHHPFVIAVCTNAVQLYICMFAANLQPHYSLVYYAAFSMIVTRKICCSQSPCHASILLLFGDIITNSV